MIKTGLWTGLACSLGGGSILLAQQRPNAGRYRLRPLPYAFDALEPHINARIMQLHYTKHHAGYVRKLNQAVAQVGEQPIENLLRKVDRLPEQIRKDVRQSGGGHYNHTLFWNSMKPYGSEEPQDELRHAITKAFGDFDSFIQRFREAALSVFGSGWAWLSLDPDDQARLEVTKNQDNPIMFERRPLLGIDMWEHAYYLQYENQREKYVDAWLNLINWEAVSERYREWMSGASALSEV